MQIRYSHTEAFKCANEKLKRYSSEEGTKEKIKKKTNYEITCKSSATGR